VPGSSTGTGATGAADPTAEDIVAMPSIDPDDIVAMLSIEPDGIVAMLSIDPETIVSAEAASRQLGQRPPGASGASRLPQRGQVAVVMSLP
jgi:hypothetical protein